MEEAGGRGGVLSHGCTPLGRPCIWGGIMSSASVLPWRRLRWAVSEGAAWWQGAGVGGAGRTRDELPARPGLQCEGEVGAWETAGSEGRTLAVGFGGTEVTTELTTEVTRLRITDWQSCRGP